MIYFLHGDTAPLQIKYEEILDEIKSNNPSIPEKIFDASLDEVTQFLTQYLLTLSFLQKN